MKLYAVIIGKVKTKVVGKVVAYYFSFTVRVVASMTSWSFFMWALISFSVLAFPLITLYSGL